MPQSTIAVDRLKALQVSLNFAPQVTFDRKPTGSDRLDDLVKLLCTEIFRANIRIDVGLFEDLLRRTRPDAVNVRQRRFDALVARNVYSKESGHILAVLRLTLPLFMTRVLANDSHDVLTLHDAARFAKAFDGGSDFHDRWVNLATVSEDKKTPWKP